MLAAVVIILFPLTFLLGTGVTRFLYGNLAKKDYFWEDRLLAGIMTMIGLAEGAHLGATIRGQSILDFKKYYLLLLGAFLAVCVLFLAVMTLLQRKGAKERESASTKGSFPSLQGLKEIQRNEGVVLVLFLGLTAIQLFQILFQVHVYQDRDLTLETVMSFLQTGKIYEVNPLTGAAYELGVPSRWKILCLPTLYAAMGMLPGTTPEQVTYHFIPAITLVASYLAYLSLGRALFPEKKGRRWLFLLLVAFLMSVGDYLFGMEGFGLMHGGFQGTTIRGAVLMPYLFGLCLRRKWKLAVCVAAVESCIVWTLYGLGMGILMILCWLVFLGCTRLFRKEGSKAWNS